MAKKLVNLSFTDIVLQADSETIRQAYEARVKIDDLLIKREEAYRQIDALEQQVEELVGEEGIFVYPAPPVPVAGFTKPAPASRPVPPKPKMKPEVEAEETTVETVDKEEHKDEEVVAEVEAVEDEEKAESKPADKDADKPKPASKKK